MNITGIVKTEEAVNGFYPTPPDVAEKLLEGIEWDTVQTVLEPSAGKGDLLKAAANRCEVSRWRGEIKLAVDCVEIDPYLRSILQYEFGEQRENELYRRKRELEENREFDRDRHEYKPLTPAQQREMADITAELKTLKRVDAHIIHDDFLTLDTRKGYDLIIMNPPFADGDAHLLKAIEMQKKNGGQIRCILNAETILNPYTKRRQVLKAELDALGAKVRFLDGAFSKAERRTDVSVAIIAVECPAVKCESTIFERLKAAARLEEQEPQNVTDLTVADFMQQIVARFNVEVDAGLELIREYNALMPYILEDIEEKKYGNYPNLTLCVGSPDRASRGTPPKQNEFVKLTRKKYWQALFSNKEFVGRLTSNLREKYMGLVEKMGDYDFTLFNIQQIVTEMNAEMGQGIQETIVALFDKLTEQHSWYPEMQKNIHYYNGWKTNKVHKINSKVIIPTYGMFSDYSWSKTFEVRQAEATISDIEKVFEYLDGNMSAHVDLHGVLEAACEAGQTKNIRCKFFDVTLYKKGTMHIKFRNQELVDRFNVYCCRKKNWLPPNYGTASYSNLNAEEKAVVDGFNGDGTEGSGETAYTDICRRATYYLADPAREMPALMPTG